MKCDKMQFVVHVKEWAILKIDFTYLILPLHNISIVGIFYELVHSLTDSLLQTCNLVCCGVFQFQHHSSIIALPLNCEQCADIYCVPLKRIYAYWQIYQEKVTSNVVINIYPFNVSCKQAITIYVCRLAINKHNHCSMNNIFYETKTKNTKSKN